ncbi:MAG: hypothetical protein HXY24_13020 [Rubrivivax sp.]|nr:hypothetical protein [Rubrivivax sp.]
MSKKTGLCLVFALSLGACGVTPEVEKAARTYKFDWPGEGIRATLEYRTVQAPPAGTACVGSVRIENYGSKSYSVLLFSVKVFSSAGELVATDRFSLSASLNSGGKAAIPADPHNPLNPLVITSRYSQCPKDMASIDVMLEAF